MDSKCAVNLLCPIEGRHCYGAPVCYFLANPAPVWRELFLEEWPFYLWKLDSNFENLVKVLFWQFSLKVCKLFDNSQSFWGFQVDEEITYWCILWFLFQISTCKRIGPDSLSSSSVSSMMSKLQWGIVGDDAQTSWQTFCNVRPDIIDLISEVQVFKRPVKEDNRLASAETSHQRAPKICNKGKALLRAPSILETLKLSMKSKASITTTAETIFHFVSMLWYCRENFLINSVFI